jgi:hypothetical protein
MRGLQTTLKFLLRQTHGQNANLGSKENCELYNKLCIEEFWELQLALRYEGEAEQFKELCDVLWVLIQFANCKGWDLTKGMTALANEYNSKFYTADGEYQPLLREDGKLLKNTGFKKANFKELL